MKQNLKSIAKSLDRKVEDLVVMVLERPRHEKLIADIRAAGARIRLIGDGDLSAGIAAAVDGSGVHAVMGTGGAPEGVLTAAAMRCLGGEIYARLVVVEARARRALPRDGHHGLQAHLLVGAISRRATTITFVATGVTDGALHEGRALLRPRHRARARSSCRTQPHQIRFIDTIHVHRTDDDLRIRF